MQESLHKTTRLLPFTLRDPQERQSDRVHCSVSAEHPTTLLIVSWGLFSVGDEVMQQQCSLCNLHDRLHVSLARGLADLPQTEACEQAR